MFKTDNSKLNEFFEIYSELEKPLQDYLVDCSKKLL